ncbi:MAG: hypothetical protein NVS3B10_05300 [Polyangiales bacterium]
MKSVFALGASLAAASLLFSLVPACTSKTVTAPPPPNTSGLQLTCDQTQCLPGNKCLVGDGELKCRRPCSSNTDPSTNCPSGAVCEGGNTPSVIADGCTKGTAAATTQLCGAFTSLGGTHLTSYTCGANAPTGCINAGDPTQWCCNDAPAEVYDTPFCKRITRPYTAGPKQWGAPCNPTGGLDKNPDCDTAQGFSCYGTSPADGAAYCTRYDCNADSECGQGFYCGTINVAPNVTTAKPTFHQVTNVCLRRTFCAPCIADFDCPSVNGAPQHCVGDQNGAGFCAPECTDNTNCALEARCIDGGVGTKICYPRAGVCIGDKSLCSPCRNDGDCGDDGLCVKGQYTTEHACAKKSGVTCTDSAKMCPPSGDSKAHIGCTTADQTEVPANYCVGLYPFSGNSDIGCYTPGR